MVLKNSPYVRFWLGKTWLSNKIISDQVLKVNVGVLTETISCFLLISFFIFMLNFEFFFFSFSFYSCYFCFSCNK